MAKKIIVPDEFNEDIFISSFKTDYKTSPQPPNEPIIEEPKRESRGRKSKREEYLSIFFEKKKELPSRFGKTITLRPELHSTLQRVVRSVSDENITLYNYIDNVLEHHLKTYDEEMTKLYDENNPLKKSKK